MRDQNNMVSPAPAPEPVDRAAVLSVDKALMIVELLMRADVALSAREIAERLGVNRTTTHRLLRALIQRGWIEKPEASAAYQLGLKFLALAHVSVQQRSFVEAVHPTLERLAVLSREAAHLGILDGFHVVHVDKVDSPERVGVSSKIGSVAVPHVTGLGKALLAASSDVVVEEYIEHWQVMASPQAVIDPAKLRQELGLTRQRGYSIDNEEDSIGVRCLGVAIRGAGGEPLFAISLTGPSPRFTLERIAACAPAVVATAAELSHRFGWDPSGAADSPGADAETALNEDRGASDGDPRGPSVVGR